MRTMEKSKLSGSSPSHTFREIDRTSFHHGIVGFTSGDEVHSGFNPSIEDNRSGRADQSMELEIEWNNTTAQNPQKISIVVVINKSHGGTYGKRTVEARMVR